jgi:hypothetical protein
MRPYDQGKRFDLKGNAGLLAVKSETQINVSGIGRCVAGPDSQPHPKGTGVAEEF